MLISRDLVSHLSPQAWLSLGRSDLSIHIYPHMSLYNAVSEIKEADDTEVILQDTETPRPRRRRAKRQSFFMVSSVVPVILQIYTK